MNASTLNETIIETNSDRHIGIDNVRNLLIVLVVLTHAVSAYCNYVSWWYVDDPEASMIFDLYVAVMSATLMSSLFFVSGLVLFPAHIKQGSPHFWKARIGKLLLPWFFLALLVSPMLTYIRYQTIETSPVGYSDYFVQFWSGYRDTQTGVLHNFDEIKNHHLWWHHLWFIPNLLLLTLLATLFFRLKKSWKQAATLPAKKHSTAFIAFFFIALTGFTLVSNNIADYQYRYVVISSLFSTHLTRFCVYASAFAFGIYLSRYQLALQYLPLARSRWFWPCYMTSLLVYMAIVAQVAQQGEVSPLLHYSEALAVVGFMFMNLLFCSRLCVSGMNSYKPLLAMAAPHSFNIYLIHYPLCILLQKLLLPLQISVFVKALLVFVAAIALSILISRYLVVPRAKICIGLLVAIQAYMLYFGV